MEKHDAAYIAGLLDSDGWVTLTHGGTGHSIVTHQVGLVNRNRFVLEWIQSLFGGTIIAHSRPKTKQGMKWSQTWTYKPGSKAIRNFLETLYPFTKIKRRQVELVLEFLDTIGKAPFKVKSDIVEKRNKMMVECRRLNTNGLDYKVHYRFEPITGTAIAIGETSPVSTTA